MLDYRSVIFQSLFFWCYVIKCQRNDIPPLMVRLAVWWPWTSKKTLPKLLYSKYTNLTSNHTSGQIIIFHWPRFPWNKGISPTKPPFGVRSCEVAIIWPDTSETRDFVQILHNHEDVVCILKSCEELHKPPVKNHKTTTRMSQKLRING